MSIPYQYALRRRLMVTGGNLPTYDQVVANYSYTGTMTNELKIMDGVSYALFTLTTSGTLTAIQAYVGDVWLCGGGAAGGTGNGYNFFGAGGGGGGHVVNAFNTNIKNTQVNIATGGVGAQNTASATGASGGTTTYGGLTALGGSGGGAGINGTTNTGGSGGSGGGHGGGGNVVGTGDGISTRPFLSPSMPPYCAGGAGGFRMSGSQYGSNGGSDGSDGSITTGGIGGELGGGNAAASATAYGGGGGGAPSGYGQAGSGYPGCVMFRIPVQ